MVTIHVKADSKIAKIIAERMAHKESFRQYVDGQITLTQLKEKGVKLSQPVQFNSGNETALDAFLSNMVNKAINDESNERVFGKKQLLSLLD